jgi:hypothetical protein
VEHEKINPLTKTGLQPWRLASTSIRRSAISNTLHKGMKDMMWGRSFIQEWAAVDDAVNEAAQGVVIRAAGFEGEPGKGCK